MFRMETDINLYTYILYIYDRELYFNPLNLESRKFMDH